MQNTAAVAATRAYSTYSWKQEQELNLLKGFFRKTNLSQIGLVLTRKSCISYVNLTKKKGNLIQPASIFYTDIFVISVTSRNSEHLFGIAVGFFPPLHNVHIVW